MSKVMSIDRQISKLLSSSDNTDKIFAHILLGLLNNVKNLRNAHPCVSGPLCYLMFAKAVANFGQTSSFLNDNRVFLPPFLEMNFMRAEIVRLLKCRYKQLEFNWREKLAFQQFQWIAKFVSNSKNRMRYHESYFHMPHDRRLAIVGRFTDLVMNAAFGLRANVWFYGDYAPASKPDAVRFFHDIE